MTDCFALAEANAPLPTAAGSHRKMSAVEGVKITPRVSVIVLGFNGRKYVDGCLTSLREQRIDEPYEVVFVDNGSKDGTADAAARHEWVRVERLDKNYGFCLGNNTGFERARGDYVVFLNQDVIVGAIGPVCAAALRAGGVIPDVMPASPNSASLVGAVADYFDLTTDAEEP